MSEKQETIINGIDVSECSYYNKDNEPYCCEIWDNECEAQNCYFKQLKRLQEENEELKNRLKTLDEEEFVYEVTEIEYNNFKKMNKYKQALEEIRDILKEERADIKTVYVRRTYNRLNKIQNKIDEVLNDRD